MEMLIFFSLLGAFSIAGISDSGDPEPDDAGAQDTGPDDADLTPPNAPTLDEGAHEITEGFGDLDHSARTGDEEYLVTDHYYDVSLGSGDDTVVVESDVGGTASLGDGDDAFWGVDGKDIVYGGAGDDVIYGGAGNDDLYDYEGENTIYGEDGDDLIRVSAGSTVVGGDGADTFSLYLSTDADSPLKILDYDPDVDHLKDIRLFVSDGDTFDLTFVEREDGAGTDLIFDGRVLAEVYGASVDELAELPLSIVVEGGTYTDDDAGHFIMTDYFQQETIYAGGGNDFVNGGPGDHVDGGDGDDIISAHGKFLAEGDPDEMSTAVGGAGDDIIISTNANVLTGGEGADVFGLSLSQYSNSIEGGSGHDLTASIITDFDPDEDVIYLEKAFLSQAAGINGDATTDVLSIQVWENGEGADILAGDEVIAHVTGGQSLRVEDLVIAQGGLHADLLGYH